MKVSDFTIAYIGFIKKFRFLVLIFWIIIDILGLLYGLKFFAETTSEFTAPSDSDAQKATNALVKYFPAQDDIHGGLVYFQSKTGETLDINGALFTEGQQFTNDLYAKLISKYPDNFIKTYASYYGFENASLPLLAENYIDANNESCYIYISYDSSNRDKVNDFVADVRTDVDDVSKKLGIRNDMLFAETGVDFFQTDILAGVVTDLKNMDDFVLPIALFILACVIQNLPIMLIPLVTIPTTLLAEFLAMYPVALNMDVVAFCPSFMMSLTYAMSIDYSLFMLSRFCEETRCGVDQHMAIERMIESAGHTILVSGSTLTLCFLGLLFFDMDMLRSVGIGSAFALVMALSINLSLNPALLFICGEGIMKVHKVVNLEKLPCFRQRAEPTKREQSNYSQSEGLEAVNSSGSKTSDELSSPLIKKTNNNNDYAFDDSINGSSKKITVISTTSSNNTYGVMTGSNAVRSGNDDEDAEDDMSIVMESLWFKLGKVLMNVVYAIILMCVIIAVTMPIDVYAFDVSTTISFASMVPHNADSWTGFQDVGSTFGQGTLSPYRLVFVNYNASKNIFSNEGFSTVQSVLTEMTTELKYTTFNEMTGAVIVDGDFITYQEMVDALAAGDAGTSYQRTLSILFQTYMESSAVYTSFGETVPSATYVTLVLGTDPYSDDGTNWIEDVRDLLDGLQDQVEMNLYVAYGATTEYDAVNAVYVEFPVMIAVTLSVVFALMGFAFKSIVAPIRSVGSIMLTLAFCFGFAVLTYQFLNWRPVSNQYAIAWLPPIMCFSIIVGLGLDYDVFLISRVLEFRVHGYTNKASVVKGLYKTGHIITAAGIIMAVAFSGLLLSQEMLLNQVAFFLVSAVLLDTFVVRTILVPVLLGLSGTHAWWPNPNVSQGTKPYGSISG